MHHLRTTLLDFAKAFILLVVIGVGAATLSAQSSLTPPTGNTSTFSPPTALPPAGNAAAPINVSINPQRKTGPLFVGTTATLSNPLRTTFDVLGLASTTMLSTDNLLVSKAATFVATPVGSPMKLLTFTTQGLTIADGTQGAGKVLTSDASGLATWQTPAASSGGSLAGSCSSFSPLVTYGNSGTYSWTVPSGVTYVRVKVIGGGGGSSMGTQEYGGSNSGASGGFAQKEMTVVPGTVYTVVVGAAGAKPVSWADDGVSQSGSSGGTSSFGTILSATGGAGGKSRTTQISLGGVGTGGTLNTNGGNGKSSASTGVNGPDGGDVPYWGMSPAAGGIEGGLAAGTCGANPVQCAKSGSIVAAGAGASGGSRGNDGAAGAKGAVIIETSTGGEGCSGATGPVGISLTDIRTSLEYVSCTGGGSASSASCSATCSAGKKVIGGGCTASFRSGGPSSGTSGSLAPNTSAPNAGRDAWDCAAGPVASNTSASVVGNAVCL